MEKIINFDSIQSTLVRMLASEAQLSVDEMRSFLKDCRHVYESLPEQQKEVLKTGIETLLNDSRLDVANKLIVDVNNYAVDYGTRGNFSDSTIKFALNHIDGKTRT